MPPDKDDKFYAVVAEARKRSSSFAIDILVKKESQPAKWPLYHYTDAAGLHGILTAGEIRATESLYLNDPSEMKRIFDRLKRASTDDSVVRAAIDHHRERKASQDDGIRTRAYIASFSEDDDDLSQWRMYADNGRGYCLGIDLSRTEIVHEHAALVKVEYGKQAQLNFLKHMVDVHGELKDELVDKHGNDQNSTVRAVGIALVESLDILAPMFKHHAYRSEKEWRLYRWYKPLESERKELWGMRPSRGVIVPYLKFSLADYVHDRDPDAKRRKKTKQLIPLGSVRVGPAQDRARGKDGVSLLLTHLGYYDGRDYSLPLVDQSKKPYQAL